MFTTMALAGIKSPLSYATRYVEAWKDIERYLSDSNKLKMLEQEHFAKSGKDVKADKIRLGKIRDLAIRVADNPLDILVRAGQHSTIVEDLNIDGDKIRNKKVIRSKDQIHGWIQKGYDKLPGAGQKLFDELYITENSSTRSFLTKLTTYSDLGAKMVTITKALEEGKKRDTEDMQLLINDLDAAFVNYDHIDSKYVQYLNDIGGVEYTKFFMRTMPAAVKFSAQMPLKMAGFIGINDLMHSTFHTKEIGSIMDSTMDPIQGMINRSMLSPSRDRLDDLGQTLQPALITGLF